MTKRGMGAGIVLSILLFTQTSLAQEPDTVYFDRKWKTTTTQRHKYFRTITQKDSVFEVKDYYKDGKIQMTGSYEMSDFVVSNLTRYDDFPGFETGLFTWYSKKGYKEYSDLYKPSNHLNLLKEYAYDSAILFDSVGNTLIYVICYYEDGGINHEGFFDDGYEPHGVWRSYYQENGNLLSTIRFSYGEYDGMSIIYYPDGTIRRTIEFKNNKRHGESKTYTNTGELYCTRIFNEGKLVRTIMANTDK